MLGIHQWAEASSSSSPVSIHASNTEQLKSTEKEETILITVGKLGQSSTQFDKAQKTTSVAHLAYLIRDISESNGTAQISY